MRTPNVKWSTIFAVVMFAELIVAFWQPMALGNGLICALLCNKFRGEEKR